MTIKPLLPTSELQDDPKCPSPENCQYTGGSTCLFCGTFFEKDYYIEWPVYEEALGG